MRQITTATPSHLLIAEEYEHQHVGMLTSARAEKRCGDKEHARVLPSQRRPAVARLARPHDLTIALEKSGDLTLVRHSFDVLTRPVAPLNCHHLAAVETYAIARFSSWLQDCIDQHDPRQKFGKLGRVNVLAAWGFPGWRFVRKLGRKALKPRVLVKVRTPVHVGSPLCKRGLGSAFEPCGLFGGQHRSAAATSSRASGRGGAIPVTAPRPGCNRCEGPPAGNRSPIVGASGGNRRERHDRRCSAAVLGETVELADAQDAARQWHSRHDRAMPLP